jgi:polysaccharide biosynthesis transport protein
MGGSAEMTVLRKHGIWLVLAMIAGIAGAWLVYTARPVTYSSTAQVDVESHVVPLATPVPPNMDTEAQIATSGVVVTSVARAMSVSPTDLQHNLSAKVSGTGNVLSISCKMPTPAAAQRCAGAAAATYVAFRNLASSSKSVQARDPLHATLVTPPALPSAPAGPGKGILLPIGAVLGLLLGVGAVVLRDRFDDRIRDRADLERCLDAPVLSAVPRVSRRAGNPALVFSRAPQSPAAEAYRYLRARLDPALTSMEGGGVLLVASAQGREGRTSVAANLATALAHAGDNVILVDADLRRPSLSQVFGTGDRPGLSDLLGGRASLEEVAVATDVPGLRLVTAGEVPGRPTDMFEVFRLTRSFARMKAVADVIVVDSSPVLAVSDALTLARVSDLVVVVADLRRTRHGDASSTAQQIRAVGLGTLVGVLNRAPRSLRNGQAGPSIRPEPESAASSPGVPTILAGLVPPRGQNGHSGTRLGAARASRRGPRDAGSGAEDSPPSGQDAE